jgi:hypothetical protein
MLDALAVLRQQVAEPAQVQQFVKEAMDDFNWEAFKDSLQADLLQTVERPPVKPAVADTP